MSESAVKSIKIYVYHPHYIYKHTFLIHGPGNSSYECKVLGYFSYKCFKIKPNKDRRNDTATRKKFNRHKESNAIVNHVVDEILLQKNNNLSTETEAHENIESAFNYNNLYQIYNMSLDDKK